MSTINLKPTHKPVMSYYAALDQFAQLGITYESGVCAGFQSLLEHCARQCGWALVPEHAFSTRRDRRIDVNNALFASYS